MTMTKKVVVWGLGNVGRPAVRAVVANAELDLVGAITHDPAKVGVDVGELCGLPPTGVKISSDPVATLATTKADAVVYAASSDLRPDDAFDDVEMCLRAGVNVVNTGLYALLHPPTAAPELRSRFTEAGQAGSASLFVSGIDPGWALDILPLLVSGVATSIDCVRVQEFFNYAYYDQPDVVRNVIGFGTSMDETPLMLLPGVPMSVWGAVVNTLADGLGLTLDEVTEFVERRPLETTIDVPGMGEFLAGTQGAFRFEVRGRVGDKFPVVVEHVTRITDDIAPDWPSPPGHGCHRVVIEGRPTIEVTVVADDGDSSPGAGGNATAAGRVVNAIPAVCAATPGLIGALDLPLITGRGLFSTQ